MIAELPMVEVLLATFNGERFLAEQIDSILAQTYPAIRILARDDGSSDGTVGILERYAMAHPDKIRIVPCLNPTRSAKGNFLLLMQAANAEYACLADQDDVWLPEKIEVSMQAMRSLEARHGSQTPLLAFSDVCVVDARLNAMHASFWKQQRVRPGFVHKLRRLLTQNVVTGCTALVNRSMLDLAVRMPEEACIHDWWIALLAAAFGAAHPVRSATVLYRQHENNVLGVVEQEVKWVPDLRDHTLRRASVRQARLQASGMLRIHGDELSAKNRRLLEAFLLSESSPSRWQRVYTMFRFGFFPSRMRTILSTAWYLWDKDSSESPRPATDSR